MFSMMEFDFSYTFIFRIRSLTTRSLRQCLSYMRLWSDMFVDDDEARHFRFVHEAMSVVHASVVCHFL